MWRAIWEVIKARIRLARSRKRGKSTMEGLVDAIRRVGRCLVLCGIVASLSGCRSMDGLWIDIGNYVLPDEAEVESITVASGDLPDNPDTPPDLPGSISEQWSFKRKDYDGTYRIAWPSSLRALVDDQSYCTVNGQRATWRGVDADNGANRPKYTIDFDAVEIDGPAECILYDLHGTALAWFVGSVGQSGELP